MDIVVGLSDIAALKKIRFTFLVLLSVFLPFNVSGAGFNFSSFHPATDSLSYLGVWSPKTLSSWEWETGTFFQFQYRPFQLYQNGARVRSVVDNLWMQHITGAVGIVDRWVEIGADLPVAWRYSFTDPNVLVANDTHHTDLGDLRLHLKTNLLNVSNLFRMGLLSTVSVPTGSENHFLGDDKPAFTESILLETSPSPQFSLALNVGFETRPDFVFRDINKTEQLKVGLGAQYNLSPQLQLLAEVESQTRLVSPYANKVNAPTEVLAGGRYLLKNSGFVLTARGPVRGTKNYLSIAPPRWPSICNDVALMGLG